jgi:AAA15 family ATPase/GTPase
MIRKIKFSNFYSFKGEQEIDFLAKKKKTYDYFQSKSGEQISKVAGFIGGNASGKTNIMRLFSFLSYFVCAKEKPTPLNYIPYRTFFDNKKISNFYIEYEDNDNIYFYEFSIKNKIILKEKLSIKKIRKNSKKEIVFLRELNDIKKLNGKYLKNFSIKFVENIRSDVSLISFLVSPLNIEIINNVFNYFSKFRTNINEIGQKYAVIKQIKIIDEYLKNDELKKEMEDFVSNFDIGLKGFEIIKKIIDEQEIITIQGIHKTKEKNKKLDFLYESSGTQSLFFTLANILNSLKNNSVVIIDEIESGLHPEALNKIITYFIDENEEKKAQLIFSSHSLDFMNKLDMHQIHLVEKNDNSESFVYRLNQIKGIRSDENFLAKYMSGAYGAFPKIRV